MIVNKRSLLNHLHLVLFLSHIIQAYIFVYIFIKLVILIRFFLSSTEIIFLYCMLNTLRYEKIFCGIDEWIASQLDPSSDVILWVLIVNQFSLICSIFFLFRKLCFLRSPCLLLIAESISLDTSGKPTVGFFLKISSSS